MELELRKLNAILGNLNSLRSDYKKSKEVERVDSEQYYEIYHIEEYNIWIRLDIRIDSYGDNETIYGLTFVKPVEKKIKGYETI